MGIVGIAGCGDPRNDEDGGGQPGGDEPNGNETGAGFEEGGGDENELYEGEEPRT